MLKEKHQIQDYEEKAKVLQKNGWKTWYHVDNWIKTEFAVKHFKTPELKFEILTLVQDHNIENICFKCGGDIEQGQALENTWVGFDDFGNDAGQPGTTMSKIGPPKLINCRKCKSCGHSFTT